MASEPPKVFISYNRSDRDWAEWIAGVIKEAGYEPILDVWHFRPGENFVLRMQEAAAQANLTLVVLSEAYLQAAYSQPEWAAAFAQDPTGKDRRLIPVRVGKCAPTGMLRSIIYIDLIDLGEQDAERTLLSGLKPSGEPTQIPRFPANRAALGLSGAPFPPNAARLHGVPDLPPHYLPRETDLAGLKQKLLSGDGNVGITGQSSAVGVQGMGGIGKTVLAAAVARDSEVRQAFPDGIYWLTIGQNPNLLELQNRLLRQDQLMGWSREGTAFGPPDRLPSSTPNALERRSTVRQWPTNGLDQRTSENDSDEILTLDRPSIIVCDHAKGAYAVSSRQEISQERIHFPAVRQFR